MVGFFEELVLGGGAGAWAAGAVGFVGGKVGVEGLGEVGHGCGEGGGWEGGDPAGGIGVRQCIQDIEFGWVVLELEWSLR